MSETYQSLSHSKWDCKYHVVFVPKRRRKAIFGQTRPQLGAIFRSLARQILKGKSAIAIARLGGKERNFTGEHFRARGYAVSTVGFELEQVRTYIRDEDAADGASGQF